MVRLQRINVVFIYVRYLAKQRAFYEESFELPPPLFKTPSWVEYRLADGTNLALHQAPPELIEGAEPSRNTVKFSMVVEDLEAAWRELSGRGILFTRTPEKGFGFNIAEFEDPEGNPIRLLQYTTMKVPPRPGLSESAKNIKM